MERRTFIAKTGATLALAALFAATPALADSNDRRGFLGLRAEIKSERKDDRGKGTVEISGTVAAKTGTTLTVWGKNGASYTVSAANATVRGHEDVALTLNDIAINDVIRVRGTLQDRVIIASTIVEKDASKERKEIRNDFRSRVTAGLVTSVSGSTFTIDPFGSRATTTVTTNASTTYKIKGTATTSAALAAGAHVVVLHSTSTNGTVQATVVHILNKGYGWLKHWIFR